MLTTKKLAAASAIFVFISLLPLSARAEMFKCKDGADSTVYKDSPCAQTERREAVSRNLSTGGPIVSAPGAGQAGLWERRVVMRPRAAHPGVNAGTSPAGSPSDYRSFVGTPVTTLECLTTSPIEALLSRWTQACALQFKAHAGNCDASSSGGPRQSFDKLSGDYRTELHVNSRIVQGIDASGKQIYDASEIHLRFLGDCKADMKPGDVVLIGEDGKPASKH